MERLEARRLVLQEAVKQQIPQGMEEEEEGKDCLIIFSLHTLLLASSYMNLNIIGIYSLIRAHR